MIYKPEIDGLRALSILLVVISHAGFGHLIPGGLGVTIFFVISGFLITSLLIHEVNHHSTVSLSRFFMRRFWRLIPPLFVFIALATLLIFWVNHSIKSIEIVSAIFYFANYYKIFGHYMTLDDFPSPYNILWSLAIEEHFYLLFAPLFYFTHHSSSYFKVVFGMLLIPLVVRLLVLTEFPELIVDGGYAYSSTETRLDSIATGCLIAIIFSAHSPFPRLSAKLRQPWVMYLGLLLLLFSLLIRNPFFRETVRYSIQNIALLMVISFIFFSEHKLANPLRKWLSNSFLVFIGKLSYSLYLYHWLAYVITHLLIGRDKISLSWQLSYWLLSIVLTMLSYFLIEQSTKKFRIRYGSNITV